MNYIQLQQMRKQAAKHAAPFFNYGAGAAANDMYQRLHTDVDVAEAAGNNYDKAIADNGKMSEDQLLYNMHKRRGRAGTVMHNIETQLGKYKDQALLPTLLAGGSAAAAGGGLTYAGLGLIPAIRKRKLLRALTSVLAGAGAGALAGHYMGKYDLGQRVSNESPDSMLVNQGNLASYVAG